MALKWKLTDFLSNKSLKVLFQTKILSPETNKIIIRCLSTTDEQKREFNPKWHLTISKKKRQPPPVTAENQYEMVAKSTTPLYDIPYEEQLKIKTKYMQYVLKTLANQLLHNHKGLKLQSLVDHIGDCDGLAGPLEAIKPSPVITGYRNKDEMSIGEDVNGNLVAGHLVGNYMFKSESPTCVQICRLINVKDSHKLIAKLYNRFLTKTRFPVCNHFGDGGHWHSIKIRSNLENETMFIVRFHPQKLSEDQIELAKEELREFFISGEGSVCNLSSLYFQTCWKVKCTNTESPYILLHGKPCLQETLHGYKFQISPDSFFQTNTLGAEVLYNTVRDYCELTKESVLFDVCCGTGTIGIILSQFVKKVVGVEKIQQAVDDAEWNTSFNNVKNAEFICAQAEGFIKVLMSRGEVSDNDDLVAVLNPGRGGLKKKLIKCIREFPAIRRVIYVTCKPKGFCFNNFKSLCQPEDKEYKGQPFLLKKAVPVDMFPQTNHCELVMQFAR
ncbi:tRNA (uracil-5-)-methyltransferase homolog B-like [Lineus longissimus]|uniref:tRNA (uracil-5-)-methyltransferase homolog B-like n=1 Tax=Lineus longissimus TaxID=88925 RepID=UPI00315D2E02